MSTSTSPLPTGGPTAGGDEFGDLFDYDIEDEDNPFKDNYKPPGAQEMATKSEKESNDAALGIDEEVEVTRKPRAPRVKLDEDRLLSRNGIPKLRAKAKHHLKFKGKGHEYSDTARLLSFYQLWLDDLFPKAKFLDALKMVEKMGHKKRMQMMRMEWINEGKPHSQPDEDTLFGDSTLPSKENDVGDNHELRIAPIFEKRANERPKTPTRDADPDAEMEDLYDATPRAATQRPSIAASTHMDSLFGGGSLFGTEKAANEDEPPEDELDALLAEEENLKATSTNMQVVMPVAKKVLAVEDDFDDEMEAMAEMEMDGKW